MTRTHDTPARSAVALTALIALATGLAALAPATAGAQSPRDSSPPTPSATPARPDATGSSAWPAWILGTQIDVITQHLAPFTSSYSGVNSLVATGDTKTSQAYGVYLGARLPGDLQVYLDAEMIRGAGISNVTGLGGITNGDVLRQGSVDLGTGPYIARAFVRWALPLGGRARDTLERGQDQIALVVSSRRLEFTAGRLALDDLIDLNRYASSTRLQFQNWGLWQNTAWDFAADTRGYSNGVAIAWIEPRWALRVASFQMPTFANGNVLDGRVLEDRGDNAELTLAPGRAGTVVRLLAYLNHGRMGDYEEALRTARGRDTVPDIVADDRPGRRKYGFGVNVEQPLADSGETGVFARYGWDDGHTESFVFTEVDEHLSAGLQLAGARWHRAADRLGLAVVRHGISRPHRDYLAAGGVGFLLGDGRLDYGHETIVEGYYRIQLGALVQVSPDVQHIWNPGYNRDRGPATVYALRVNFRY